MHQLMNVGQLYNALFISLSVSTCVILKMVMIFLLFNFTMLIKCYVDVQKKALFLFYLLVSRKSSIKKESLLAKSHTDLLVNPKCALKYVTQGNFSFDSNPEISRAFLCLPSKNEGLQEQTQSNNYHLSLHV